MIKKACLLLFFILACNVIAYSQSIFIGAETGINICYLGSKRVSEFSNRGQGDQQLTQLKRTYRPGFYSGLTSDFYPLKGNKKAFLISLNLSYQQYSQAISWSGKADSLYPYSCYKYYESKTNRELHYSILLGTNIKGFIIKTGVTFKEIVANSGQVVFTNDNNTWLNSGNTKWPSQAYKLNFSAQNRFGLPFYIGYMVKLSNKIYITPEAAFDLGLGKVNIIDFGYYGITWGQMVTASVGVSVHYLALKK